MTPRREGHDPSPGSRCLYHRSVDPIASGRDADVFALDETTVLRRYRTPGKRCEAEALTMRRVHALGFPVPRVHSAKGPDLVLDRVHGPTMRESVVAGTTTTVDGGRALADLHRRLHALPVPRGGGTETIRHLDLHPDNVIMSPAGPVVIDWRNSDTGPPAMDVALTAVILAQVALSPRPDASAARGILTAYLAAAGPLHSSDLDQAIDYRSADRNASSAELDLLREVAEMLATEAT
jgi:aminoglycoside phosphotransferase (APT) family kinase protein